MQGFGILDLDLSDLESTNIILVPNENKEEEQEQNPKIKINTKI